MSRKKRILFVGEASSLHTGFATYYRELLPRLAATGKYELAEIGCVPDPFALIEMADGGMKPISNIRIGDKVISHIGVGREVTQIHRKEYSGQLTKINRDFLGGKTLEVTSNHPVYAIKKDKAYIDRCFNRDAEPQWVEAGDLSVGDFVAYTVPKATTNVTTKVSNGDVTIDLDDDFAFFAGWFLAEGFVGKDKALGLNHFGICASLEEEHIIQRIKDVISRVFNIKCDYHRRDDMGVFEIKVANRPIAKFLCDMFGTSSHDKLINYAIFSAPHSFLLKMLAAYAEGDGTSSISRNDIVIKTAGNRLAIDVVRLLYRTGIRAGLNKIQSRLGRKTYNGYRISIAGEYARRLSSFFTYKNTEFDDLTREETFWIDNVLFCRVSQIHRRNFDGTVYNFAVQEDESYICNNFVVHNSYARQDDPKVHEFIAGRWKFYGVMPRTREEQQIFNQPSQHPRDQGRNINQFGAHVFDSVVADFKPDVVIDIRDNWMLSWQLRSPFRPWFKLIWMPTVDAEPQQEEWIRDYEQADMILAYSDYGVNALRRQSPKMRVFPKAMRPGVDLSTFKPMDHAEVRGKFFLREDLPIIGSLMRNQSRKLYPDLLDAFARMKNLYADKDEVVKKATLLLHSSWPDNQFSYDYPRHIMRLQAYDWMPNYRKGIKNDILQTLMCHNPECGAYTVTMAMNLYNQPIQNGRIVLDCIVCGKHTATCPSSGGSAFSREGLAEVYNLMDLYVQCSICFTGDTSVLTPYGWQSIRDIKVGDKVVGRDGKVHNIYKTMVNETDSLVSVKLHGSPFEVECTPNHPFLVVKDPWPNDKRSLREKISQKMPNELEFEYCDAGDLKPGDMCVQTIPQQSEDPHIVIGGEDVEIDEDMAWFLGVMIGDGNVNINNESPYCRVTCALNDDVTFDKINVIAQRFGREAKRRDYADRKAFDVSIYNSILARDLHGELYADDKAKKMPSGFEFWPTNLQKALIDGLIHADGHTISDTVMGFTGTSVHVARSLYLALQRLGLNFNAHQQHPKNRKTRYKFEVNMTGKRSSTSNLYWSQDGVNYLLSKVKSVENVSRNVDVFNIDVEDDHNYVVCGHTVHNCEGDGMPIQEAKACGVPTLVMDYTAMREKGRFPGYEHFDEIGISERDYSCHLGGETIDVDRYYYEPETSCMRALPDIDDMAHKMRDLLVDKEKRDKASEEARIAVEQNYDWDKLWKQWEFVLDGVKPKDRSDTWETPIVIRDTKLPKSIPDNLDDGQFLEWLYLEVLKYPRIDDNGAKQWAVQLQNGIPREQIFEQFKQIASSGEDSENARQRIRAAIARQNGEKVIDESESTKEDEWI